MQRLELKITDPDDIESVVVDIQEEKVVVNCKSWVANPDAPWPHDLFRYYGSLGVFVNSLKSVSDCLSNYLKELDDTNDENNAVPNRFIAKYANNEDLTAFFDSVFKAICKFGGGISKKDKKQLRNIFSQPTELTTKKRTEASQEKSRQRQLALQALIESKDIALWENSISEYPELWLQIAKEHQELKEWHKANESPRGI
jgi:hypothetical protein